MQFIVGACNFCFQGFSLCGVFCAWQIELMTGFEKSEAKNPPSWYSNASFTLTGGVFKEITETDSWGLVTVYSIRNIPPTGEK